MTSPAEIAALLKPLADAYPGQPLEKRTLQAYLEHLADLPAWLLEKAVRRHIQTSPWFPKIAELRQHAARLAGTSQFETLDPSPPDPHLAEAWALIRTAQWLEDAFFHQGRLDPDEWERLAAQFERVERPYRAGYTREKLRRLQQIAAHR
jgi:hypothetical protein